jgi:hypothetical protein
MRRRRRWLLGGLRARRRRADGGRGGKLRTDQRGSFDALLMQNGVFAALVSTQLAPSAAVGAPAPSAQAAE